MSKPLGYQTEKGSRYHLAAETGQALCGRWALNMTTGKGWHLIPVQDRCGICRKLDPPTVTTSHSRPSCGRGCVPCLAAEGPHPIPDVPGKPKSKLYRVWCHLCETPMRTTAAAHKGVFICEECVTGGK